MKTNLILCILFTFFCNVIYAQTNQPCTTVNFSGQTAGWTYSQGAHVGDYANPTAACSQDRGIITPGVGGNNPCNIQTAPMTSTGATAVGLSFDIIVLNANLKCNTWKDYACETSIDVFYYIGGTKYTGTIDQPLPPNGPTNSTNVSLNFNVGNNLPAGTVYRIEFCFKPKSGIGNCNQQNTKYVFDNFRSCETPIISQTPAERPAERLAHVNTTTNTNTEKKVTVEYPNLIKAAGKITANGDSDTKIISLVDNAGKVIQTVSGVAFFVFDTKGLTKGTYFVQFEKANGDQIRKRLIAD